MKYIKTDRATLQAVEVEIAGGTPVYHSTNSNFGLLSEGDIEDIRNRLVTAAKAHIVNGTSEQFAQAIVALDGLSAKTIAQQMFGYEFPADEEEAV